MAIILKLPFCSAYIKKINTDEELYGLILKYACKTRWLSEFEIALDNQNIAAS